MGNKIPGREFTWKRFCAFCNFDLLWSQPDSTALHCFFVDPRHGEVGVFGDKMHRTGRWEQGCSCPKLECAVAAYKCHKIPWPKPKEQGVSVFLIVCHLFGSFRAEMKCTYLRQSNWQNYFIAQFQQELFMLLGICAAFGCLIPNTRWTWKRSGSLPSPWWKSGHLLTNGRT